MAAAASDLESKAKAAFVDDDFELAVDLYSQAIDVGPATADLYADRAQAHIKLGSYTGTCLPLSRTLLRLDSLAYVKICLEGVDEIEMFVCCSWRSRCV
jgi:hypothetical protein